MLTLVPSVAAKTEALIDMDGGDLEIIAGQFFIADKRDTPTPAYLIRVRGGDLACAAAGWLVLSISGRTITRPSSVSRAKEQAGHPDVPAMPLARRQDAAGSQGSDVTVRLKDSVLWAAGDALVLEALGLPQPRCLVALENNTVAVRQSAVRSRQCRCRSAQTHHHPGKSEFLPRSLP